MIKGIEETPAKAEELYGLLFPYVKRGRGQYGHALIRIVFKIHGEHSGVCFNTQRVPFRRIRNLVDGMNRWNDGRLEEEFAQMKHGADENTDGSSR